MQCAALRHGITAGDIKTEMQCTLLNIRQCADFQPDIRYPRNAVLFSLFADMSAAPRALLSLPLPPLS